MKPTTEQIIHSGLILQKDDGENSDALYIGEDELPLAEMLEQEISGRMVNVRYFITDFPETKPTLIEGLIQTLYGGAEAEYSHAYSEYTGYLWTDENIKIGGHNLLKELTAKVGKYLYLEIDIVP